MDCLYLAINLHKIFTIITDKPLIKKLALELSAKYPTYSERLSILSKTDFVATLLQTEHIPHFFRVFGGISRLKRERYFNLSFEEKHLTRLLKYPYALSHFIKKAVTHIELDRVHKSLLKLYNIKGFDRLRLSEEAYFFLAMNAVRAHQNTIAYYYLRKALKQGSRSGYKKNRTLFWLYQTTLSDDDPKENSGYLRALANSALVDIYTLYALERLGLKPNVVATITLQRQKPLFNIKDPFAYQQYIEQNKGIPFPSHYNNLAHTDTIPHLIPFYNRYFSFKKSFFLHALIYERFRHIDSRKIATVSHRQTREWLYPNSHINLLCYGGYADTPFCQ